MGHRLFYMYFKQLRISAIRNYGTYKSVKRPNLNLVRTPTNSSMPKLIDVIREKIRLTGPITVADYMNIVATNPREGYYVKKDVIGREGDFITSPEISQLFGEMIALWFYSETRKMGLPRPLQLVELGPGRATLLVDMLRVIGRLGYSDKNLSLHLVEISQPLQQLQATRLCIDHGRSTDDSPHYYEGVTLGGSKVYWYDDLQKVPYRFSWFVAHEFFDALPVHVFEKTPDGWRELLIDINSSDKLEYRLSAEETSAVKLLVHFPLDHSQPRLEMSGRRLGIARQLAGRVDLYGGLLLIADYGHCGEKGDTFRAFRKHQLVDPLDQPGSADLTADVDFSQLPLAVVGRTVDESRALVAGPVTQKDFLERCHAPARLKVLMDNANEKDKVLLQRSYDMLTSPEQMGHRFKFMAFYPSAMAKILNKYPPLGFSEFEIDD